MEPTLARLVERVTLAERDRERVPVRAPYTDRVVAEVPRGTEDDVREAVRRARDAQRSWSETSLASRARVFARLHDLVLARQDELLDLVQLESGKARKHAFEEILDAALVARWCAFHAARHLRPRRRRGAIPLLTAAWEHHVPRGVVGIIAPWNYPLTLTVSEALPALMAGNGIVIRPDLQTSLTALRGVELMEEAGIPPRLMHVVTGEGPELGPPLIDAVDYIAFTGSTRVGRVVAQRAAQRLIGASLELGGKNPMLVLADADIERAAEGAVRACFSGTGQLCISVERLLLHESVYNVFVERFVERTKRLVLAASFDYDADVGSLVSARQLARVEDHVRDAVARGARVLAGGRARPDVGPFFYEPTILADVAEGMTCFAEETFGPVVAVSRFSDVDDAIARANATEYGLNASVWTRDTRKGRDIARRIRAGTVNVNEAYAAAWGSVDAPMGGMKDSGLGRRHAAEGLLKFTESQTIAVQRLLPLAAPRGVSDERFARVMTRALSVLRRIPGVR